MMNFKYNESKEEWLIKGNGIEATTRLNLCQSPCLDLSYVILQLRDAVYIAFMSWWIDFKSNYLYLQGYYILWHRQTY